MKKITDILFGALIVLAFVVGCNWKKCNKELPVGAVDTICKYIRTTDTIWLPKAASVTYMPTYIKYHDTTFQIKHDTLGIRVKDSVRYYTQWNKDSTVNVESYLQGKLLSQIINSNIPITTIHVREQQKYSIYGMIAVSPASITPNIIVNRNRSSIGVGYDILNKQPVINYGIKLYSK